MLILRMMILILISVIRVKSSMQYPCAIRLLLMVVMQEMELSQIMIILQPLLH